MSKKLMILGASVLQLPAIKKAKEMGLSVVVVDMNPDTIGFKEEGVEKEVISTIDIPKVVEAAKKHRIDGIMTLASDLPMRTVAAVAKEMSLIGIDEETAIKATNKFEMRMALEKGDVPVPHFYRVNTLEDFRSVRSFFSGKFVTKPADNSGSRGICLIDDLSKAEEGFLYSKENSHNGDVVVEEYMEGPEVSVETISVDGKCYVIQITDKLTTGAPHFVEMGHSQPSQLPDDIKERIKQAAIAANKAVGIKNGPSHTEIIVTNEGPKIVEIGARLGGDCITTHLVPLSTGVDMVENCIKIALGEQPNIEQRFTKGSAIRYFHQTKGIISSITGIDDAMNVEGVQTIEVVHGEGERIDDVLNSASRAGFVIAQASDAAKAVRSCEEALSKIHISYK